MANLIIRSPLRGWAGPLDEVPDAVFAQRLLGDGVAVDPTGAVLCAPCDGVVIGIHHSRHAVTFRAGNGAELLLHIGLDTVAMGGDGFEAHVADGARVKAGDRLISFDLDRVATRATSLITPVIVTNGDLFTIVDRGTGGSVEVGDALFELAALAPASPLPTPARTGEPAASRRVVVGLTHGVHARPAARIAERLRQLSADVELRSGTKSANARSAVAVMALGVQLDAEVEIVASGSDAAAAVAALAELLAGDPNEAAEAVGIPVQAPAAAARTDDGSIAGVTAAPGIAIGTAVRVGVRRTIAPAAGRGLAVETAALAAALGDVRNRLTTLAATGPAAQREVVSAHLTLLDDPEINTAAAAAIELGAGAAAAWSAAMAAPIAALRAVTDPRIAARADDLLDLEYQVADALGDDRGAAPVLPDAAILLASDLLPSQLMAFDPARIAGICTAGGGPTSHVAIIAAAMNIPAVVAAGPAVLAIPDGTALILDADAALLYVTPGAALLDVARTRLAAQRDRKSAALSAAAANCRMADGNRIEVFANLGSLDDAPAAVAAGAEGCGLLRTELLFLDRSSPPGIDEQAALYQAIAGALDGRPLIIRTLDIGGDKPVAYLDIPREDNPALGLRGIRVGLWDPALLRTQLAAMLRVQPAGQCRILLPMITDLAELAAVRAVVDTLRADLGIVTPVQLGVMIETPAAAVSADILAADADFFAVGTNDLTQYTLAMDRGNPMLAAQLDGLHPAVLRMIEMATRGASAHARPVGVCGGLASDLAAIPILIGLGITELSAVPALVPEVKALVRTLTLADCTCLARRALAQSSAAAVRALRLGGE